jgi:hypothetical protein
MSMLKFDHDRRPSFQIEGSDFRAHYENVAVRTLLSIGRSWRFIASSVTVALALACIVLPLLPRKYSAVALVYPSLFSTEQGKAVPRASLDASSMVIGEARLIVSDAILQAVVRRLKLAPDAANARPPSWLSRGLDGLRGMFFPETRNYSQFDRTVAMLRNKVEVVKDTRSYLISISFTGSSADEAAGIVNAVALEYLRDKAVQRRQEAVTAAEDELTRQLAVNGEKHPKVLQASDALGGARAALDVAMSPKEGGRGAIAADNVKLAIPNRTPTSPKGFVILGLSFILGLLGGVGLAVWCDRRGFEPRNFLLSLLLPRLRSAQLFIGGLLDRHVGGGLGARLLPEATAWRRVGVALASPFRRAFESVHGQGPLWRRIGIAFVPPFRRTLAALNFPAMRRQTAALPSGGDQPGRSGTNGAAAGRSSGRRRRRGRRFKHRKLVGREEHPPGP